ncbi:MAG: hypothetical protein HYS52_00900 [Candidatus Wildermuthbacteria bacterium]|nr:hypothetical protein [Candidatus Wildermuthbacteria bacterium]
MKRFIFALLLLVLLLPIAAEAVELNLTYPTFPGGPNINNPAEQNLANIIAWFYYAIVGIAGFAAFVMIVWGGVQWMGSAGNPQATGDAKDKVQKALLGLLIVLASVLLLQIVNPELTQLRQPSL